MMVRSSFQAFLSLGLGLILLQPLATFAGNEDRAGSAGGAQLLIDPWARNTGLAGANGASLTGIEATYLNVSGMAMTDGTELMFTHTRWMAGTSINAFGFSQKVGDTAAKNALGLNVMSLGFGDIPVTTTRNPNGGLGSYSPTFMNVGVSYAKGFTNTIYGGFQLKILSQGISNMRAQGVALDAGIRYITGERDQIHFGMALKNIGPPMKFSGDGLSFTSQGPRDGNEMTVRHRSDAFELPSLLNIAGSYEFDIPMKGHGLIAHGTFVSNSFTKDQMRLGFKYSYKELLRVRGGYIWQDGINSASRTTMFTGPTAGISVKPPISGIKVSFDYSYRSASPFDGMHSIGARVRI